MARSEASVYRERMNLPDLPIGPEGVAALIPHAGAMRLIDRVDAVAAEDVVCSTRSHLAPENPLRSNGIVPASAAIEYAAQAMAVHAALTRNAPTGGGPPRRGFLVVASGVTWSADRLDGTDAPLTIKATRLASMGDGAQYAFTVESQAESAEGIPAVKVTGTLTLQLEPEA
jgi:predicted hotdog family 3-hydroxylacyl-ACP dehydratase